MVIIFFVNIKCIPHLPLSSSLESIFYSCCFFSDQQCTISKKLNKNKFKFELFKKKNKKNKIDLYISVSNFKVLSIGNNSYLSFYKSKNHIILYGAI